MSSKLMKSVLPDGDIFGSGWKESFRICTYSKKGLPSTTSDIKDKEDVEEYLEKYLDMEILSVSIYASEVPYDLDLLDNMKGAVGVFGKSAAFIATGKTKMSEAIRSGTKIDSKRNTESDKALMKATCAYEFRELYKIKKEAHAASFIHHDFVKMDAKGEKGKPYFLTIEKMYDDIIIQAAEDEDTVRHCILSSTPNRNLFQFPLEIDVCKDGIKFQDVINQLYFDNELQKGYSVLPGGDHCQHFSKRVFEFLAKEKKYPPHHKTTDQIFESLKEKVAEEKRLEEIRALALSQEESGPAEAQPQCE